MSSNFSIHIALPETPTSRKILAAVSGGPDSIALLHALHAQGQNIHVAHLNHGLRVEAVEDAAYVEQFCAEHGIPVTIGHADIKAEKKKRGGGVQDVARQVRYEFLERVADEVDAVFIATAHTADDQVETVLLNILRGTGTDGLRGIPAQRGRIIRPMLHVTRAEVESYCAAHGLTPREDMSNRSTKYSRNEVRLKLLPYLEERFNPGVRAAILRLSDIATEESEYLDQEAREWLGNADVLDTAALGTLAVALQRRILHLWLSRICAPAEIGFDEVERVRAKMGSPFTDTMPGGLEIEGDGFAIRLRKAGSPIPILAEVAEIPIGVPGSVDYQGWHVTTAGSVPSGQAAILRTWRDGDRIKIASGHKKLQDLFVDAKIPRSDRATWPVLVDASTGDMLAVANLRISLLAPDLKFTAERLKEA